MNKEKVKILTDIQLSNYIGEKCIFCNHKFKSIDDINEKNITCAGRNIYNNFLFACKECWNNHIQQGSQSVQKTNNIPQIQNVGKRRSKAGSIPVESVDKTGDIYSSNLNKEKLDGEN